MKRFFSILLFLVFLNISSVYAAEESSSCKYKSEVDECINAVKSYTRKDDGGFISPGASLREITDYPCLQAPFEQIVYQISLHKNNEPIDEEMDLYLGGLSKDKDKYFGQNAEFTFLDGLDHITDKARYFEGTYSAACSQTIQDSIGCVMANGEPTTSVRVVQEYLAGSDGDCKTLADAKISIFKQVSYNLLLLNQQQVLRDEKKLYDQELRSKYSNLIDLMAINLGYIERIWQKIVSYIKNTH